MTGVIVLQGGGPFTANDEIDRRFLSSFERIVMLPTADAYEQPQEMVDTALAWGERIGLAVEPLMIITRRDADEQAAATIDAAPAVALAGDSSIHLRSALKGTPVFAAIERLVARGGTVLATGASAGALCDPMTDRRGGGFAFGLGLVPGLSVLTEVEIWPHDQLERAHELATTTLVDLPTGSAIVRSAGGWETIGKAVVHGELPT
jgi:cyanophycinase